MPYILGLTASPVMRSDPQSLVKIEETLDAICRTPTKHREELRLQVNLPVLSHVYYKASPPESSLSGYTRTITSLGQVFGRLRIEDDPYVMDLLSQGTEKSLRKLEKVRLNHKTWCQQQIKTLHATGLKIYQELGAWAADYYVSSVVTKFMTMANDENNSQGVWDTSSAEKRYLAMVLKGVEIIDTVHGYQETLLVSDKVSQLIETILADGPGFSGIIFVQERALVAVLAHLLSIHPSTRNRVKVGTMIGASMSPFRRNIGELVDVDLQKQSLSLFKSGVLNLIVATSVLEEGIDVPACNLVICFHKPANLKSFVQRRGRARHQESRLILMMDSQADKLTEWESLERDMKAFYEEEMRMLQEVLQLEDSEEHDHRKFRVESTGALLDLDNAVQHLYHFCSTLPAKEYVDLTPEFICSEAGPTHVKARVILPLSVNDAVRTAESRSAWMSEKNAIKDCAFEAYIALYKAGLVNQHLLPLLRQDSLLNELTSSAVETRASIMVVHKQLNPWTDIAKAWKSPHDIHQYIIQFGDLKVRSYLPIILPSIPPFILYWDLDSEISLQVQRQNVITDMHTISRAQEETLSMLEIAFGSRFLIKQKQPIILFGSMGDRSLRDQMGHRPVLSSESSYNGLIRDTVNNTPYHFSQWLAEKPQIEMVQKPYKEYMDVPQTTPHLSLTRISRRKDFLHKIPTKISRISTKPYAMVLPTSRCTVDDFPVEYAQFALTIPSIMRRVEVYILAQLLGTTILRDVGIKDVSLIVSAISASSAREETNYQRLEFFGDMTLKFCTSVQLVSKYPLWHEGYLSAQKDRLVANSRLSRAAVEVGLDRFILTKAFTGHKWRPLYVDDLLDEPIEAQRDMSSKVLADVVEALIGAAMLDGGFPAALACLRIFLPEIDWQPLEVRQVSLFERVPDVALPATLHLCEELCGYRFSKKSLLVEAMTHASCNSGAGSLERLEFLGDGVLDRIITTTLFEQQPPLSHFQMHVIRTALVNADFLGFMCMEWTITEGMTEIVETGHVQGEDEPRQPFQVISSRTCLPLWRFLRHHSPRLAAEQAATSQRHAQLRVQIKAELEAGRRYPWALLARLQAPKFYSDIVESLLGAIWVDSGSLDACQDVLEGIGALPYLRRLVADGVQAWHPKEEIGVLAGNLPVQYVVEVQKSGAVEDDKREFTCSVLMGEMVIVRVGGGVSSEEVKTRAAETAVRALTRPSINGRHVARESELEMEGLE